MPEEHKHDLYASHASLFMTTLGDDPGNQLRKPYMDIRILCHAEKCQYENIVVSEAVEVQDEG